MTLRELSVRLKGALWNREQEWRISRIHAWQTAAWTRAKKLPTFKSLLRERGKAQTPKEIRSSIMAWAASNPNIKYERHVVS